MKISVVISTFNRSHKLKDCLESVKDIADEIIVVNNSSSDNTVEVAKKYTKNIFTRPNNPMLNVNKNYGFSKANKEWILYLDDDEKLTPHLQKEIEDLKSKFGNSDISGFWIPRKNMIFGKWIEHSGWYPDYQLRLFKKEKGKFPEIHVHEMIELKGKLANLDSSIMHDNYKTINEFLYKMVMTYAPNEAEVLIKDGYKFNYIDVVRFPVKEFLSRFFARKGYKDGLHGLMLSLLMAFYHLVIFGHLWEAQKYIQVDSSILLPRLDREIKDLGKEFRYWSHTRIIETSQNFFVKICHRIGRKIGL